MGKTLVRFLPDNVSVEANLGDLLLDVALEAGVFVPASCGGSGACAQCRVRVVSGSLEALMTDKLQANLREAGYVLACQSRLTGDVTIEIPAAKVGRKVIPRDEAERMRLTAVPIESPIEPEINPMTLRVLMDPPAPRGEDNRSDFERIARTLKVDHDIHPVTADLGVLRDLPMQARKADWKITASLHVDVHPELSCPPVYRLAHVFGGHLKAPQTALAVDIGTTSLWGELVNLETGEVLARASRYNPQISMGDDVISRIVFALKKDGLDRLQRHVVKGLNEVIEETLEKSGQSQESIHYMVAAGNTVMTHLFLGLYPKFLRESPYVPVAQKRGAGAGDSLGPEYAGTRFRARLSGRGLVRGRGHRQRGACKRNVGFRADDTVHRHWDKRRDCRRQQGSPDDRVLLGGTGL